MSAYCCIGHRVFPGNKERPGRDADPSLPFKCCGHERVELYLYSPYGPYGLYRTSVLVQGCTLLLPLPCSSGKSVIVNKRKSKDVRTKTVFPCRILQILPPKWLNTSRDLLQRVTAGPQNECQYDSFYTTVQVTGHAAVFVCGQLRITALWCHLMT